MELVVQFLHELKTNYWYYNIAVTAGGFILDSLIGDPVFMLHPVRLIGKLATCMETITRKLFSCPYPHENNENSSGRPYKTRELLAGILAWIGTLFPVTLFVMIVHSFLFSKVFQLALVFDSIVIWASIARKDLAGHAIRVFHALRSDAPYPPVRGRQAVSMMVGRDVSKLDANGVARACVESIAESSVDGVTAPLMYGLIAGPWAALVYRIINTMDSMFGHKTERYLWFGKPAARADDIANFIPARVSGLLACLCAPFVQGHTSTAFRVFIKYRLAHESPNAGHPESAYAGALGLWLGGTTVYTAEVIEKPVINPDGRDTHYMDIKRALTLLNWNITAVLGIIVIIIVLVSNFKL